MHSYLVWPNAVRLQNLCPIYCTNMLFVGYAKGNLRHAELGYIQF